MTIYDVSLTEMLRWHIRRDDPAEYDTRACLGWSFINPLVYPAISRVLQARMGRYRLDGIVDDAVLIETTQLLFRGPSEDDASGGIAAFPQNLIPPLLAHLRRFSKQAEMARISVGGADRGPQPISIPTPTFPDAKPGESKVEISYHMQTAITWKHLEQADAGVLTGEPPLPVNVLLDALLAYVDRDDRRAILYAAMAVEIIARTKLGFPNAKTPYVQSLLHTLPLKQLGRSLKNDDPGVFRLAERLYEARNNLVHQGGSHSQQGGSHSQTKGLPLDGEGAYHALECANAVFQWFGEPDDYMPAYGAVKAEVPVGHVLDMSRHVGLLPRIYQSALARPTSPSAGA